MDRAKQARRKWKILFFGQCCLWEQEAGWKTWDSSEGGASSLVQQQRSGRVKIKLRLASEVKLHLWSWKALKCILQIQFQWLQTHGDGTQRKCLHRVWKMEPPTSVLLYSRQERYISSKALCLFLKWVSLWNVSYPGFCYCGETKVFSLQVKCMLVVYMFIYLRNIFVWIWTQ